MDTMMTGKLKRPAMLTLAAATLALSGLAAMPAQADSGYAAAKAAGPVGGKTDGYIGIVGASTPELRRIVDDINIRRRAVYAEKARAQHATIEEYAFTSGCVLIAKTAAGEKYQAPDGSWQTRTAAAPIRDPRCP